MLASHVLSTTHQIHSHRIAIFKNVVVLFHSILKKYGQNVVVMRLREGPEAGQLDFKLQTA
jgi:hypothetical protein